VRHAILDELFEPPRAETKFLIGKAACERHVLLGDVGPSDLFGRDASARRGNE